MASPHPWPELRDDDRWLIDLMEERFHKSSQTPDQMRARARRLRAQAARMEIRGVRDANLAMADRYELAAAARAARADQPSKS
jgi:hypothetical protein